MTQKTAKFYGLSREIYGGNDRPRVRVVDVTTIKNKHWWGRDDRGTTSGLVKDITSRFDTRDEAIAARTAYNAAWNVATPAVTAASMALDQARQDREDAAMKAVSDLIRRA